MHASTQPSSAARPGWAVATSLVLSALSVAAVLLGIVIVGGGRVLPSWAIGGILVTIALTVIGAGALVRRRGARRSGADRARARRSTAWVAASLVCAVAGGLVSASAWFVDRPSTYTVLSPTGGGSCQVAVRESSFVFAGGGDVYAVGTGGLGRVVGSWTADDGHRPVASGTYALRWDSGRATLELFSDPGNPVWPATHEFACP